ncbi:MAG: hypothetical protein GY913_00195 [Proteobacteria bacterium]|nr:hypothetical protein [Pseudomonadota bacterium]MCP4915317.1 hypothetical protein [Pseudomonadota bacterium]
MLVEHNQFDKEPNTSLLLAWQKGPGRAVFLGGSLGDPQAEELSWQAFAKASWVLQL